MSDPERNRWFSRRWQDWVTLPAISPTPLPELLEPDEALEVTGHALLLAWREERAQQSQQERAP
ncbi:hypothetical protein [Muricoccus vinaceus]|uniref:Uncharacterized protein n=1 Tax=Muricoccus vinaceus TaxID=424704 RepID=A0ABV6IT96_9PROT